MSGFVLSVASVARSQAVQVPTEPLAFTRHISEPLRTVCEDLDEVEVLVLAAITCFSYHQDRLRQKFTFLSGLHGKCNGQILQPDFTLKKCQRNAVASTHSRWSQLETTFNRCWAGLSCEVVTSASSGKANSWEVLAPHFPPVVLPGLLLDT
eukprot:5328090-Amphidinium_carterae.1